MPDPNMLKTQCPHCNKGLLLRPDQEGRRLRCPKCKGAFTAQRPVDEPANIPGPPEHIQPGPQFDNEWLSPDPANELILAGSANRASPKAKLTAHFDRSPDLTYQAFIQAIRSFNFDLVEVDKTNLHVRFAFDDGAGQTAEHDLYIFASPDGSSDLDMVSRMPDPGNRFPTVFDSIIREASKYLMFATEPPGPAPTPPPLILPSPFHMDEDFDRPKRRYVEEESSAGTVCSILSCVFGGIAFLVCPPLFGLAGLTLGIIGVCLCTNKVLGVIGLVLSAVGTIVGMLLGIAMTYRL